VTTKKVEAAALASRCSFNDGLRRSYDELTLGDATRACSYVAIHETSSGIVESSSRTSVADDESMVENWDYESY
jgi:hypothetical protein